MRLLLSLAQHGWHPASSRVGNAPMFQPTSLVEAAHRADEAQVDAALFGLPASPSSDIASRIRMDPLPLVGAAIAATREIGLGAFWPCDGVEPFHVARVMATLDHLSGGRTAWVTNLNDATAMAGRAAELILVAGKLWDSWEDGALLADQAIGRFADPARVHPIHHEGRFFTVRGPLNVPRPVQGRPVLIYDSADGGCPRDAIPPLIDLVLARCRTPSEAGDLLEALRKSSTNQTPPLLIATIMPVLAATVSAARRRRDQLDALSPDGIPCFVGTPEGFVAELVGWHAAGVCDGFDLRPAAPTDLDLLLGTAMPILRRGFPRRGVGGKTLRGRLGLERPAGRTAPA